MRNLGGVLGRGVGLTWDRLQQVSLCSAGGRLGHRAGAETGTPVGKQSQCSKQAIRTRGDSSGDGKKC